MIAVPVRIGGCVMRSEVGVRASHKRAFCSLFDNFRNENRQSLVIIGVASNRNVIAIKSLLHG